MKECQQCKRCFPDTVTHCPDDGLPTFHSISGEPVLEGKYKLDKRLGQGGMGVVYCSRHAYLKTQHAIKVILPDLVGNDPQLVTRFRQEALAAAAIRHHNVIAVTDFGVAQGTLPFLVMEFVEGESLHDLLTREKRLAPERALELMSAICAGVGAAHRQGIVHRDLKPLNVMIQKDRPSLAESVKILDFGLAKIKSGELLGSFIQAQTTGLMGSPYYMAPEQWADEDPDAGSDIYSLGVMLFQMIAGDVPFKGSSIPAIMKKHLYDLPPSLAEYGVQISPQVELAIRHMLEKDRAKRTQTTEQLVEELRTALGIAPQTFGIHVSQTTGAAMPVSTLHILTRPPQSKVFVDNVSIGQSQTDGWLLLEGMQSGNHLLRVSHDGFQDWESEVVCDGSPKQVVAQLRNAAETLNSPTDSMDFSQPVAPQTLGNLQGSQNIAQQTVPHVSQSAIQQTAAQNWQTAQQNVAVEPVRKKSVFSPLVLAIVGIFSVLLLGGIGVGAAYMLGWVGKIDTNSSNTANVNNPPTNTNINGQQTPPVEIKNEMINIPGGSYKMGRNDSAPQEQPEHEVQVKSFWMDKTEVTNAEYAVFVRETNHKAPTHWVEGKPVAGKELFPVVFVSLDDVNKFIEWRSKRDKVQYRLPTEEEWEYAARNGNVNNLYPWGDKWEAERSVVEQTAPKPVGSFANGANKWGVQDLIGNVWEWTSSKIKPYPNSQVSFSKPNNIVIRGGSYNSKTTGEKAITTTTRYDVEPTREDGLLGFRLVRSE